MIEPIKFLYSRNEAAEALGLSLATIDVLVGRGMLRTRRQGKRVLIPQEEIERFAKREHASIWPPKQNGVTVRGYRHNSRHPRFELIDLQLER